MPRALRLDIGPDRLATLTIDLPARPVNLLGHALLEELEAILAGLALDGGIGCLVLLSGKPGSFVEGSDLSALAGPCDPVEIEAGARFGQRVLAAWETLPFPTVAAVRGTCLGGGAELALASSYLLLSDHRDLRIGLPEVRLGLLPAWGACGRLLRRAGLAAALELLLSGETLSGERAAALGIADVLLPDALFPAEVRRFAEAVADRPRLPRPRHRKGVASLLVEGNRAGRSLLLGQARARLLAASGDRRTAPLRILEVLQAHLERGEAAGLEATARAFGELATCAEAENLLRFGALAAAAADAPSPRPAPRSYAVVGAGETGSALARLLAAQTGAPVRLCDPSLEALAATLRRAAQELRRELPRAPGREAELRRRVGLLRPAPTCDGLERCEVVIEAVPDEPAAKRAVLAEIAARAPRAALLATTSSSLPLDAIAEGVADPARIVGLHLPRPVERTSMAEVVAAPRSAPAAVESAAALVRALGRTPVVVADGPGFLVHRLLAFGLAEALWLLEEGHPLEAIDEAMADWGMSWGLLQLADAAGLDLWARIFDRLRTGLGERFAPPVWFARIAASGRLGRASGRGFYRYEREEPVAADRGLYDLLGLAPRRVAPARAGLAERIALPMVNEAARCLAQGVVAAPGTVDLALVLGAGFAAHRGGLCRWAEGRGLERAVAVLHTLAGVHGPRLEPAPELIAAADRGGFAAVSPAA